MKKLFFALFCFVSSLTFALPFNSKLSGDELEKLNNGEVIIRNLDSRKDICMTETEGTSRILKTIKDLNPNYLAEVIQIRPYEGNENLIDLVNNLLLNIRDYVGIPYYSVRAEKWYELYSSAQIKNISEQGDDLVMSCVLEMEPFGKFSTEIRAEKHDDRYFYSMRNMEKLEYYEKFTAVKPEKMNSCITVFRDGNNWILYSIGAVDTYKLFFFQDRVETSFMNRIKTFCNYIFTKIK